MPFERNQFSYLFRSFKRQPDSIPCKYRIIFLLLTIFLLFVLFFYVALEVLKNEAAPAESEVKLKSFDAARKKLEDMIDEIALELENVTKLKDERDIIEAKVNIRNRLAASQDQVHVCGKLLKKMAKEKAADESIKERNVRRGHDWLEGAQRRLIQLAEDSSKISSSFANSMAAKDAGAQARAKRRNKRERRGRGGGDVMGLNDFDLEEMGPETDQEQAFAREVAAARREEEELLQLISEGLDELQDLALTLNKLLKKSARLIDGLNTKMDNVQTSFDKTNAKMEKLLEASGGISRWCPICICIIVLLACAGFIAAKVMNKI